MSRSETACRCACPHPLLSRQELTVLSFRRRRHPCPIIVGVCIPFKSFSWSNNKIFIKQLCVEYVKAVLAISKLFFFFRVLVSFGAFYDWYGCSFSKAMTTTAVRIIPALWWCLLLLHPAFTRHPHGVVVKGSAEAQLISGVWFTYPLFKMCFHILQGRVVSQVREHFGANFSLLETKIFSLPCVGHKRHIHSICESHCVLTLHSAPVA